MESLSQIPVVYICEKEINEKRLNAFTRINSINIRTDERITTMTKMNLLFKPIYTKGDELKLNDIYRALSHIAVWESFSKRNSEYCLIFEEECIIPDDYIQRLHKCIQTSLVLKNPNAWDIWVLGGNWEDMQLCRGEFSEDGLVYIGTASLFLHAYILSRKTAELFLKNVYPLHVHMDTWISAFSKINQLKIIGCTKIKLENQTTISHHMQLDTICKKCSVPINMYRTHLLVSRDDVLISQLFCIALIVWIVYQNL